mgnify:CR=1 FL=1
MSEGKAEGRCFRLYSTLLAGALTLVFAAVLARIAQLQLHPSDELVEQMTPRVSSTKELSLRGDMTDRLGRLLSATRFSKRVVIDPTLVADLDKTINALAPAIGVSSDGLGQKLVWAMGENRRRTLLIEEAAKSGSGVAQAVEDEEVVEAPVAVNGVYPTSHDDGGDDGGAGPTLKKPIRYLVLSGMLDDEQVRAVRRVVSNRKLKIKGVSLESQALREFLGGDEVSEIVGLYGWQGVHKTGSEARKDKELQGQPGKVGYVRDAAGTPLWVEAGQIQRAVPGNDVRLSIDLEIQRIAIDELTRGVEECDAQGGRILVMDPNTGEVLAMADVFRPVSGLTPLPLISKLDAAKRGVIAAKKNELAGSRARFQLVKPDVDEHGKPRLPGLGRNRCVEDVYEPGSTFKPFVWSVITELGRARPDEIFDTEGGGPWITPTGKPIRDVRAAATMTWREVLINSSNIGMIKGSQRLSAREFHDAVSRFGFGKRTTIGLPGESKGVTTPLDKWTVFSHTSMAYGNEVAVTPLQMVRAFAAFARNGEMAGTMPRLRMTASAPGEPAGVVYRVLPEKVATLTREAMSHVALSMESKYAKVAPNGSPWKFAMFGKSGTSRPPAPPFGYLQHQYVPSFIAAAPFEDPMMVVLVVIDDPGPERIAKRTYYGAATAGPIVRKVMERALTYLGAKPSAATVAHVDTTQPME